MRQDERRDLSRVPPNRPGRVLRSCSKSSGLSHFPLLGSTWRGPVRRLWVLVRAAAGYLVRWRKVLMFTLWLLGLLCQVLLLWLAGELLDLFISAVELWLELAEKHLRIVLEES